MKKLTLLVCGACLLAVQGTAIAGEMFTIKAFARPAIRSLMFPNDPNPQSQSTLDVITVAPFDCNGTSTDRARMYTSQYGASQALSGSDLATQNAGFLAAAELINAAKLEYVIETRTTTNHPLIYNATNGGCSIYDYYIHVQ